MAEVKSVLDYMTEGINARFARRLMSTIRTEHERFYEEKGIEPSIGEYNWLVKRMHELMDEAKISGEGDAKKAAD